MPPVGAPPSLLFRQYCLLAGAAGVFALRRPAEACLVLAALFLFQVRAPRQGGRALALVLCFGLGLGWTALREPQPPPVPAWLEQAAAPEISAGGDRLPAAPVALTGRVQSCEPLPDNRLRVILTALRPADNPAAPPYAGALMVTFNTPVPRALKGMEARLTLRVAPVRGSVNPQLPDRDRLLADSGVFFIGSHGKNMPRPEYSGRPDWGEEARAGLEQRFLAALAASAGNAGMRGTPWGYAPALIFNDRSFLTAEQLQRLADTGIIHSLALSGLHLGYAAAAGCLLLWGLARCRPGIFLRLSRPKAAVCAALPVVLLCLWLGQTPVTLVRAFFMFLFWGLLIFLGRPKVLLDGLTAALGLMMLLSPTALFDIRLQLSFTAVASIALALPAVTALTQRLFPHPANAGRIARALRACLRGGCTLFLISSAIQIMLLPLTVFGFTAVPVLAPLNVIWLPVLGFWVMPLLYLALALCAVAPTLAAPVLYMASLPLEALDALLVFLSGQELFHVTALPRPHPISALGWWLLLLTGGKILYNRIAPSTQKPTPAGPVVPILAAVLMLCLPPYLAAPGKTEARLTVLDVGSGQSVLLEWNGGRVLLDGGPAFPGGTDMGRFITGPVAAYNARPKLDLVLASHPDADHLGGLLFVLEHFEVDAFGGNGHTARPEIAARLNRALARAGLAERRYIQGDVLDLSGGMRLEILWPPDDPDLKGNNASLVVRIVHHGRPLAVVCGDAERPALETLARQNGSNLAAPVLVLPHHGSATALCPEFYRAVGPQFAVASSRLDNQWGFPSKKVRNALAEQGIPLLSTGDCGQIQITGNGSDRLEVHTAREMDALGAAAPNPAWGE